MKSPAAARTLALVLMTLAATAAPAADTAPPPAPAAPKDKLAAARQHVAQARWADAIAELKRVNDSGSADWNNLMGYTHRKQATPDLAAAERYYDEALRLDPKHKGALEYSGELYLMKGDVAKAEARLATLEQVCPRGCEEQADLKKSLVAYKASGKAAVKTP